MKKIRRYRKILIISLVIFLLTGCKVSSNIEINKNLSVSETVNMGGTIEFFNNRYKMMRINVIKEILAGENREEYLISNGYKVSIDDSTSFPVVIATKNYKSLEDFTNNTIFKNQYFGTFETTTSNSLVTLHATDFIVYEDGDLERFDIANCSIKIKVPYEVVENNADSYDKKTNTFIWNIKRDTIEKEIKLTFDKNHIFIYNSSMYISMIIMILLIITLLIIILKLIKKHKNENSL